jgi:hypothetical protein
LGASAEEWQTSRIWSSRCSMRNCRVSKYLGSSYSSAMSGGGRLFNIGIHWDWFW